jgi:hypothetical protein
VAPSASDGSATTTPVPEADRQPSPQAGTRLEALREGQWLELPGGLCARPVEEPVRARLLTILGERERFVFANERGMKIAEVCAADLGDALLREQASTLDDALLFDRALAAVIGDLRQRRTA